MSVVACAEVDASFHVRRNASGKIYRYSIWNGPGRAALLDRRCWHVRFDLDLEKMQRAADQLVGEHDYTSFRASGCQAPTPGRRVTDIAVEGDKGGVVTITFEGNAFLQHMVRIMVGTIVEVGRGAEPEDFPTTALKALDRAAAGPTAPAKGLTLELVRYDPSPFTEPQEPPG